MADPTIGKEQLIGIKYQKKVRFFFLGLIFGILAVSIQTASFQNSLYANYWEVFGWAFMLLAGICG